MITKAVEFIKSKITGDFEIGIILGSGLGTLGEKIENPQFVDYAHIPDFPVSNGHFQIRQERRKAPLPESEH